ncbi:MAG: EpsG family protein [Chitinispirillales bacterium]|jgi:hypothetical protein|nr:EpsG family protein [Chitinispirillales bacterium]
MLQLYIYLLFAIQIISFVDRRPRFWAFMSTLVVVLFAAFRNGGADFGNYLKMTDTMRMFDGNFFFAMLISKDIMVGLINFIAVHILDWVPFVFITFAVLSGIFRYLISVQLGRGAVLFCTLYGFFLAPALDFAAIRAALAIPLIALAMLRIKLPQRLATAFLAFASHASALVSAPFAFVNNKISLINGSKIIILSGLFTVCGYSILLILFPRTAAYSDRDGMIGAYFPITLMALITLLLRHGDFYKLPALRRVYWVSVGLIMPCFIICSSSFILAFRLLEIQCYLLTYTLAHLISLPGSILEKRVRICLAFFILFVFLPFKTMYMERTWTLMNEEISYFDLNY